MKIMIITIIMKIINAMKHWPKITKLLVNLPNLKIVMINNNDKNDDNINLGNNNNPNIEI